MKIVEKLIYAIVLCFGIFSNVSAITESEARQTINNLGGLEKFLKEVAKTLALNAPQTLDSETKIISVFSNGNTLNLTHELINVRRKDQIHNLKQKIIDFQSKKICTSPVSKVAIQEFNAVYHYLYLGGGGAYLFDFDVDKKVCNRY